MGGEKHSRWKPAWTYYNLNVSTPLTTTIFHAFICRALGFTTFFVRRSCLSMIFCKIQKCEALLCCLERCFFYNLWDAIIVFSFQRRSRTCFHRDPSMRWRNWSWWTPSTSRGTGRRNSQRTPPEMNSLSWTRWDFLILLNLNIWNEIGGVLTSFHWCMADSN